MPARTIEEVITKLENIVAEAKTSGNSLGIFSQLYLNVTKAVQLGIQENRFANGKLMERLDVIFANRYLDAYDSYLAGQPCSQSWQTAFDAAKKNNLLTIQHLLMGMNAHINLDLGIAASETVPPQDLMSIEADFFEINNQLASSIEAVQNRLGSISPMFFLLDWFGKKSDEHFAEFSLVKARSHAWIVAQRLSKLNAVEKELQIAELDGYVSVLNMLITDPGIIGGTLVKLIKWFELKDVKRIISVLSE